MTAIPTGPTSVQDTIPSYLYTEYNDDPTMQAFVQAFNIYAQAYITYINNLNLPVYTNGNISGSLLDWVALGLYGIIRPSLPTKGIPGYGPFNTYVLNQNTFNGQKPVVPDTFYATSDDTFKRVITWAFFNGDTHQFNTRWLKRRIARFLNGMNGTNYNVDETYTISVVPTGFKAWKITLPTTSESKIFSSAVSAGVLELPIQIEWTVDLT